MGISSNYKYLLLKVFVFFIILSRPSYSQQTYTISSYTVNEGLPQSTVYSMLQDKRGFLWFATYGGGLARFDGVHFKIFTENDSLKDNKIYKIMEDSKGNIWIGGRKGITIFDGYEFKKLDLKIETKLPQIRDLYEDSQGHIWIATYGYGVFKYEDGKISRYSATQGLSSDYVYCIDQIDKESFLFGTKSGISLFNGRRFTQFDKENSHKHNSIRSIIKSNTKGIYYGAYGGGLCNIKDGLHTCISLNGSTNRLSIMALVEAKNGDIWVGTFGEGIYKITEDTVYNINQNNSNLTTNNILSLYEDNLGNIYAGTFLGGVNKISETAFYSFSKKDGLDDPSVENLYELKDGSILMTLMSGGVNVYANGVVKKHPHSDKIGGTRITSVFEDHEGYIWMTTDGSGVFKIKDDKFEKLNFLNGKLPSDQVFTGMESSDSAIWLGTYGDGIIRIKDKKVKLYNKEYERGLKSNQIMDIEEDAAGNVWFATNGGGITKYDGINFITFNLKTLDFVSIRRDLFDNLWFASNGGGIFNFDHEEFKAFTTEDGLSSNNVNLICFDNANNLWVGSEKGINKIVFELKDKLVVEGKDTTKLVEYVVNNIESYSREDGLIGIETNNNAVLKDSQGNLWFGTVNGVSKYNPKADKFNIKAPVTQIINLKLGNQMVDWKQYSDSIVPWSKLPLDLSLDYNQNHLTFEFVGINLNVPHGVMYKYKLDGFNEEWIETDRDFADYNNLSPGEYTFNVIARNEDGIWQQEPTAFTFEIKKPFWLEYWFITLVIVCIIIVIFTVVKRREHEIRKRNLLLEKTVNERTKELKREKEKIEQISIEVAKKNEQILDSIQYAKRIQLAILPPDEFVRERLPNYCIIYEAKDIVSGDFYWLTEEEDDIFFAAVDCTGHGVPGAFMSIVGYRLLELLINGYRIHEPCEVLDELHMQVLETLHKQKGSAKDISDGMDIALCAWNRKTGILKYSGAHNPLYLIRNGELIEYPSDSRPIGMSMMKEFKRFRQHEIKIEKGDIVYIFTDGFADQFGGEKYRKYYYQNFQNFLLSISHHSMDKQKELIHKEFYDWKGDYEQIDDVLVFGVQF